MDAQYHIRLARPEELASLPELERVSAQRFEDDLAEIFSQIVTPLDFLHERIQQAQVWVAATVDHQPVGFAIVSSLDGNAHLDELDVHPDHGRRGIGRALVERACAWARKAGCRWITLSTLRTVPWNAPFYAKLGFRILADSEVTPELRHMLESEARLGLPMQDRVAMRLDLQTHHRIGFS